MFDQFTPIDYKYERRKRQLIFAIPMLLALGGYLYYEFKNYPEERAVSRFLQALEQQDYQQAYRLWQPSQYYTFKNFSEDWGADGAEGPVRDFDLTGSRARGSGVLVDITLNGGKQISLWVERSNKSLSFPP